MAEKLSHLARIEVQTESKVSKKGKRLLEELFDKWQMFRLTNKPRHLIQVLTRGFPMRALSPLVQAIV